VARHYRRDLIGHFIRRRQREQQPCGHACCRGYRVHPDNYPVILPNRLLRSASDEDLAEHYKRVSHGDTAKDRRAEAQIIYEMERRDRLEEERRRHREAVETGRAAQQMERDAERERLYLEAEAYTRGNWVNTQGQARGISDREILTGREEVFQRYASEEAREYFRHHPRPTGAYFRGKDTRIAYSDPGRARRPRRRTAPSRRVTRRDLRKAV
jgi:hypothetical protein